VAGRPEQVAGRLAHETGRKVISYESVYRFIYAQIARTKDYRWRHYLPRAKSKRGRRRRRGGSTAKLIEGRVSLAERPPAPWPTARARAIGKPTRSYSQDTVRRRWPYMSGEHASSW
jgi:IS30 family transposase